MNAVTDHIYAIKVSFEKLFQGKFWLYLIPSLIIFLIYYSIRSFFSGFVENTSVVADVPLVGSYLDTGVQAAIGFMDFVFYELYKFLILTLLSPINCLLSEKVDNELTGAKFSGGIVRILSDLLRAIFIVIIAMILNLFFMFIWWLFAKISGFHIIDEIMYFLIGSFFIGFSFYDFSLERYGVGTFGSWSFGFGKMTYMLSTGAIFSGIYLIPDFGVVAAPFLVTIISTATYLKLKGLIPLKNATTHEG